jgi:hypothetical protein
LYTERETEDGMGKTRELYWTNTKAGHNKDYKVVVNLETFAVTSTWGPIGGHHSTRSVTCGSLLGALELMRGKRTRRLERGYDLEYDRVIDTDAAPAPAPRPPVEYMGKSDFIADLVDLRAAEKISSR